MKNSKNKQGLPCLYTNKEYYYKLYKQIYELTNHPVIKDYDCGLLCSARCCSSEGDRGIYLYPYEEVMFDGSEEWLESGGYTGASGMSCPSQ